MYDYIIWSPNHKMLLIGIQEPHFTQFPYSGWDYKWISLWLSKHAILVKDNILLFGNTFYIYYLFVISLGNLPTVPLKHIPGSFLDKIRWIRWLFVKFQVMSDFIEMTNNFSFPVLKVFLSSSSKSLCLHIEWLKIL